MCDVGDDGDENQQFPGQWTKSKQIVQFLFSMNLLIFFIEMI